MNNINIIQGDRLALCRNTKKDIIFEYFTIHGVHMENKVLFVTTVDYDTLVIYDEKDFSFHCNDDGDHLTSDDFTRNPCFVIWRDDIVIFKSL